jgi:hypothetical protein
MICVNLCSTVSNQQYFHGFIFRNKPLSQCSSQRSLLPIDSSTDSEPLSFFFLLTSLLLQGLHGTNSFGEMKARGTENAGGPQGIKFVS